MLLLHGNGPGGLHSPSLLSGDLSPYDWTIGVSDLQLSGHPDLIVREKGTGRLYALAGTAHGLGQPGVSSATASEATTWPGSEP